MENKQTEVQIEEMEFVEKCVEEAPTSELEDSGILVDGRGVEQNASN